MKGRWRDLNRRPIHRALLIGKDERVSSNSQVSANELSRALRHHQAGRLEQAEEAYRRILSHNPEHPDALHLLGTISYQWGKYDLAVELVQKAISRNPFASAFHNSLGAVRYARGELEAAIECFQRALGLEPRHAEAHVNLIGVLRAQGNIDEALKQCRKALELTPDSAELQYTVGVLLGDQERLDEAINAFRHALRIRPDYSEAHNNIGVALQKKDKFEEAFNHYEEALRLQPGYAEAHHNMGSVLHDTGRLDEAVNHFRQALHHKPDYAEAHNSMGAVLLDMGRLDEAINHFEQALRLNPDYGRAYCNLMAAGTYIERDKDRLCEMEHRLKGNISIEDRIALSFALGKAYDDLKMFDAAFRHYRSANELKGNRFDAQEHTAYTAKLMHTFSKEFFAERTFLGSPSELPIFIIGMPRSGTTLVEQIISTHPRVFGAGELEDITHMVAALPEKLAASTPYPQCAVLIDQNSAQQLAETYLEGLVTLSNDLTLDRVTDKMPANFLHLGLICLLFPKARIIHCRRDPLDVCLSCYFHDFTKLLFTNDLRSLGIYYREYKRLMEHWDTVLHATMMEVYYEELVERQQEISKAIIRFCGLEWDDRCLAFHKNDRPVRTASNWQVRQPIYYSSVGRWKNYDMYLDPLKKALAE